MGMGFQEKDAKRALRLNNQDIASSVDFLIEERAKKAQKREQDLQRQSEILYVLTTVIILVMIFNFVVTLWALIQWAEKVWSNTHEESCWYADAWEARLYWVSNKL